MVHVSDNQEGTAVNEPFQADQDGVHLPTDNAPDEGLDSRRTDLNRLGANRI